MSYRQIESCSRRLAEIDKQEAKHFREMMENAFELTQRASQLRREAWGNYRAVLGVEKRDDNG